MQFPSPEQLVTPARRLCPKRKRQDRAWKARSKVSANISKDFPWEIVLSFLRNHKRSMILLQMVDRNLRRVITTDHKYWLRIFKWHLSNKAYCVQEVKDPLYPCLRLWKSGLHGVPVHNGILRGDPDDAALGFGFDEAFTSYVRRAFALTYGTRCGMCGNRYRHEVYWSLRMRVCRLCVEANTVSSEELYHKYGVDYSDLLMQVAGRVFMFQVANTGKDDRVGLHCMRVADLRNRAFTYLFWVPHLSKLIDLPALCQQQLLRKEAAAVLSAALQQRWILGQRQHFALTDKKRAIDCLVLRLKRNERSRLVQHNNRFFGWPPYVVGGPYWAGFSTAIAHCGKCKFTARNAEPLPCYFRLLETAADCVV
jgi:hypothetical protein